ncbi:MULTISPECIES: helix-turn-helix domain-containing protein [Mycobacterium]|uniref:Resolvase HTH domain-containing protein n=1 Tax=Mycobacterium paragordonae TaxID=1389713 RepID=A0ABQ1CFK5_9MYCO|nr:MULTISPECIES: helix-turn-helix domain-containing protein [Mycobacterium]QNI09777.1 helix-turn-helix domain-containing protein [Mycobacterium kubicae]GFG83258.1 hypothetical protein MPRG_65340 [Mycobacterium paragordonae]
MPRGARNAEQALTRWRHNFDQRDPLVRHAHDAGVPINRIHRLTGISRSTIYRILDNRADTPHIEGAAPPISAKPPRK